MCPNKSSEKQKAFDEAEMKFLERLKIKKNECFFDCGCSRDVKHVNVKSRKCPATYNVSKTNTR